MKPFIVFVMALAFVANALAADGLTEKLQRGLFEEEANHNLDAAIKSYESVIQQGDEQRKIIATAIFRLGECYRKLGRTNEANAQYQRIVRDFSEQEQLVRLANDFLKPPIGIVVTGREPNATSPSWKTVSDPDQVRLLQEEIKLAEQQVAAVEKHHSAGVEPLASVLNAKRDVLAIRRLLPENSSFPRQRSLLNEQVKIVEQLLKESEERVKVGVVPVTEPIPLRRELLTLRREMMALTENSTASTTSTNVEPVLAENVELARELERRHARLQGELSEAKARFDVLSKMPRERLLENASQFFTDSTLTELQQRARDGDQRLATMVGRGIGQDHPDVIATKTLQQLLRVQINERLDALVRGQRTQVDVLTAQFDAVANELQKARRAAATLSADNPLVQREEVESIEKWRVQIKENPDLVNKAELGPPLYIAVKQAQLPLAEFLITNGANVNARGPEGGQTALHLAAGLNRKEFVELLLKHGANVNAEDYQKNRPLSTAATGGFLTVAQLLIDSGAELNVLNNMSRSPLMMAIERSYRAMTELLLKRGADPNFGLKNGNYTATSPMSLAISAGNLDFVKLLVEHKADVNLPGKRGETPLLQATRGKQIDIMKALLAAGAEPSRGDEGGFTPLIAAADNGSAAAASLLLDNGANADVMIANGAALHFAAQKGHDEVVRLLLDRGAKVNAQVGQGVTALFRAVQARNVSTVKSLLDRSADPNIVSENWTPLDYARTMTRNPSDQEGMRRAAEEMVALLLERGANPYLNRTRWIAYGRNTNNVTQFFHRTTNDWNRYTLFELLAGTYNAYPFADLGNARINRVEGGKLKDIPLNLTTLFEKGDCSNDMWLEWGDMLIIPELDHNLGASPTYFPTNAGKLLERCLARSVSIIVKGSTNALQLVQPALVSAGGSSLTLGSFTVGQLAAPLYVNFDDAFAAQTAEAAPPKALYTFRLKDVISGSQLLRTSSDQTRARVSRRATADSKASQWTIDLTKIVTSSEWPDTPGQSPPPNARGKLSWRYDLWLRDGDVIEIPEKQ